MLIWITGLSGAGKTTLAHALHHELITQQQRPIMLDGDRLREAFKLFDLNHSVATRKKLAFCYSRLAHLLSEQDQSVIVSTISMFEDIRQWNRSHNKQYLEIYLDIPKEERIKRSYKNIYEKNIDVVELDEAFEAPLNPDLIFYQEDSTKHMLDTIRPYLRLEH